MLYEELEWTQIGDSPGEVWSQDLIQDGLIAFVTRHPDGRHEWHPGRGYSQHNLDAFDIAARLLNCQPPNPRG